MRMGFGAGGGGMQPPRRCGLARQEQVRRIGDQFLCRVQSPHDDRRFERSDGEDLGFTDIEEIESRLEGGVNRAKLKFSK
jgi:hypothetical protein